MALITLLLLVLLLWFLVTLFMESERKFLAQALKNHHDTRHKNRRDFALKSLKPFFLLGNSLNLSFLLNKPLFSSHFTNKLLQAGLLKEMPLKHFLDVLVGSWISATFVALVLFVSLNSAMEKAVATFILLYFCIWPILWLEERAQQRANAILKQLPTISSAIAITMESGLSFYQAIMEITTIKKGPLIDELTQFLDDVTFGHSRIEALERMGQRIKLGEMTLFITLLTQGLQMGAYGLAAHLKTFSNELWLKRVERAKKLAAQASIKLFLPLLLLVLPAMFIFILSPAVFSIVKFFI